MSDVQNNKKDIEKSKADKITSNAEEEILSIGAAGAFVEEPSIASKDKISAKGHMSSDLQKGRIVLNSENVML